MAIAIDGDLWMATFKNKDKIQWTQITNGAHIDRDPAWSPDGRFLYYASNQSGNYDIWRISFDRKQQPSKPASVIATSHDDTYPDINSNGTIIWVKGLGNDADLWMP